MNFLFLHEPDEVSGDRSQDELEAIYDLVRFPINTCCHSWVLTGSYAPVTFPPITQKTGLRCPHQAESWGFWRVAGQVPEDHL